MIGSTEEGIFENFCTGPSKIRLRVGTRSTTDLEARLVGDAVEGKGITFDVEVAPQLFANFFNALLDHLSGFPGFRPRDSTFRLCAFAQHYPRAIWSPVSSILKSEFAVITSFSAVTASPNLNPFVA